MKDMGKHKIEEEGYMDRYDRYVWGDSGWRIMDINEVWEYGIGVDMRGYKRDIRGYEICEIVGMWMDVWGDVSGYISVDEIYMGAWWDMTKLLWWDCVAYQLFRECENRIYELSENTPG